MLEQAFEVATEFRFDVGSALLNTKTLQNAVGSLSNAAGGAVNQLNFLASGLVARLGFGSGGLLTVLSKAVELSESFDRSALNFSNVISSNMEVLSGTIHTFNDRLDTSKMILDDISNTAIKFAIPTSQLTQLIQLISTPLAQRGKLGTNFSGAIRMSSNLLMGAESVGLHPQVAAESLQHALSGLPIHGQLFARLVNTQAFRSQGIRHQTQMQMLDPAKRIDLLDKALASMSLDAEALERRLGSLRGQFTILMNIFSDIGTVLRPIGEAIKKPLIKVLQAINSFFLTHGKEIGENIGKLIGNIFDDPKALFYGLMQFRTLKQDFKKALHLTEIIATVSLVQRVLGMLGVTFNGGLIGFIVKGIAGGVRDLIAFIGVGRILRGIFFVLRAATVELLVPFGILMGFFQIISRARAIAWLSDVNDIATLTPRLTQVMIRWKAIIQNITAPFRYVIDTWAEWISPLFKSSTYLQFFVFVLEELEPLGRAVGDTFLVFFGILSGIMQAAIGFIIDLGQMNPDIFKNLRSNFVEGYQDWMNKNSTRIGEAEGVKAVQNIVTNIGKQEIRFDMREQLEPDRIAFKVGEALKKAAMNKHQGRGQSLSRGFLDGQLAFSGNK